MSVPSPKRCSTRSRATSDRDGGAAAKSGICAGPARPEADTPSSRTFRRPCTPRKRRQAASNSASPESTAASRVFARVEVWKSSSRYLRVTVRARMPCWRSRRATASHSSSSVVRRRSRSRCRRRTCAPGRCSSRLRPRSRPRGRRSRARAGRDRGQWVPSRRSSRAGSQVAELADGAHPDLEQHLFHLRAHAPQAPHGQRSQERRFRARRHHHEAVRLAHVGGDLRHQLRGATPTEAVSCVRSRMAALSARAMSSPVAGRPDVAKRRRLPVTSRKASSMETGSTASVK